MSGITLAYAQAILDGYLEAQRCDPAGNLQSVTINGRSVTYSSAADLMELINYWSSIVARLQRSAAGGSRYSVVLPNFSGRNCR